MQLPNSGGSGGPPARPPHADPGELGRTHPRLADALVSSSWSDGSPKRPARLSVGIYGGRIIGQLDLMGTGLCLKVELPDPILLYDALEACLGLETPPWEQNPYVTVDAAKKGRKK